MATLSSLQTHLKNSIKSWAKNIYYTYCQLHGNEGEYKYTKESADNAVKEICINLYSIYKDDCLYWENFSNWYEDENKVCKYCGINQLTLDRFYEHVQSDRYTRGKSLEVDRKVGRMKEYVNGENPRISKDEFIEKVHSKIENTDFNDIVKDLYNILDKMPIEEREKDYSFIKDNFDNEIMYLPAPYTEDNCVLACYWCNNAKTDAFTDKQFAPIGDAIKSAINNILESSKQTKKGNS